MKIYDITQEVFSSVVYPGDPSPSFEKICDTEKGSLYNLTVFSMCAHNGTHVDAPKHFLSDGKSVEEIDIEKTVGYAYVAEVLGMLGAGEAREIFEKAEFLKSGSGKRILLKGECTVTADAAREWRRLGVWLIGVESQSVGPANAPMEVHKILLSAEVVLLEGIRLCEVKEGVYFLFSAPLALGGADGAPVRAILVDKEDLL